MAGPVIAQGIQNISISRGLCVIGWWFAGAGLSRDFDSVVVGLSRDKPAPTLD